MTSIRALVLALACAASSLGALAAPAQGAVDPLFVFRASENSKPGGEFNGPCGLAVDAAGNFYVSDYYHHAVDTYNTTHGFVSQIANVDPGDGPCGLAIDSSSRLYVNNYHRNVLNLSTETAIAGAGADSSHPTGVAVNSATNAVYVDKRTVVAVYDSSGAAVDEIGLGSLGDGYGVAVSQFASTNGRIYVPDAASKTVEVYDPTVSKVTPVQTITGPLAGFTSLTDSAVAVDRITGDVYVADRVSSPFSERPESTIQVFDSTGTYKGHLKFNVIDAAPVGLAVDNSFGSSQGRVYVTSGNTSGASVIAYEPGAVTSAAPLPPGAFAAPSATELGARDSSVSSASEKLMTMPAGTSSEETMPVTRRHRRHSKHRHTTHRHQREITKQRGR
jgi:hypothetical protein